MKKKLFIDVFNDDLFINKLDLKIKEESSIIDAKKISNIDVFNESLFKSKIIVHNNIAANDEEIKKIRELKSFAEKWGKEFIFYLEPIETIEK